MIETHLLVDLMFRIDRWYWIQKGQSLGLTTTEIQNLERDRKWIPTSMGYPVEERIVTKLQDHALQILIPDYHLGIQLELPSSKTAIPDFDAVHWHAKGVFRLCMTLAGHDPLEDGNMGIRLHVMRSV